MNNKGKILSMLFFYIVTLNSCTTNLIFTSPLKEIFSEKLTELNADSGLVLIMDRAGEVIDKVSLVADNGRYKESDEHVFNTPREIGTLFTPVSMLTVLNENKVSATDYIAVGDGVLFFDDGQITDHNADQGGYGEVTAEEIIAFDSKVGIAKLITGNYTTDKFIQSVKCIGLDFIADSISLAYLACGTGIKISPISMLSFYNDIANNKINAPELKTMLQATVKKGTANYLKSDSMHIAGKTGKVDWENRTEVSFCGYYPIDNPQYSFLVIISNPKKGYPSGGVMAGDVVKRILKKRYL